MSSVSGELVRSTLLFTGDPVGRALPSNLAVPAAIVPSVAPTVRATSWIKVSFDSAGFTASSPFSAFAFSAFILLLRNCYALGCGVFVRRFSIFYAPHNDLFLWSAHTFSQIVQELSKAFTWRSLGARFEQRTDPLDLVVRLVEFVSLLHGAGLDANARNTVSIEIRPDH
jgi:hypothetical protein